MFVSIKQTNKVIVNKHDLFSLQRQTREFFLGVPNLCAVETIF